LVLYIVCFRVRAGLDFDVYLFVRSLPVQLLSGLFHSVFLNAEIVRLILCTSTFPVLVTTRTVDKVVNEFHGHSRGHPSS
jgi:hypothetical protein